ncbi:MAG: FliH/SctL family protein [Clostridiales bacterium]|nr:FliH/SctL family protein [Eubacteriales bacterium]MDH7564999.1 FliH/SctL family protein [Clostridiales bacterium]
MSNRIFKNYQVNLGTPFQVKTPLNFDAIKKVVDFEENEEIDREPLSKEEPEDILEKAREEARYIIEEARLEAQRLVADAETKAADRVRSMEEEAWKKGFEEGYGEAKKQYEDLLQEAERTKEHAKAEYREVMESMEADIVETILDIAKKVIGDEVGINKENLLYVIKHAFEKCTNRENIILKVSPEDYEFVEKHRNRLLSMVEGVGTLEIKKDSSLKTGACIVETLYGCIDAGVQTKMKRIEEAFRQTVGKR